MNMYAQLYLDYNATTPCATEVVNAMLPYFQEHFGNASSGHHPYGWMAKNAIESSNIEIAKCVGVPPTDLVFTSGATESINAILTGVCRKYGNKRRHIITTKAEHKAVLDTCAFLSGEGFEITYLDVRTDGLIDIDLFKQALRPDTLLAAIMFANNETGVIQPLDEISAEVHRVGAFIFSDATQALGKLRLHDLFSHIDFACFSGHKLYGPKGIGITYIKNNASAERLPSFIQGGGQQKSQRGGTLNTPLIVGLAKAVQLAHADMDMEMARMAALRDRLENGLLKIALARSNSASPQRLPNTVNVSFPYVDGASLLRALGTKIAVSNGSACNSASVSPSHVLLAMGVAPDLAMASLRISLGRFTTDQDIEFALAIIAEEVAKLRGNNILWERAQAM